MGFSFLPGVAGRLFGRGEQTGKLFIKRYPNCYLSIYFGCAAFEQLTIYEEHTDL
jgi:hypothetical protein